MLSSPAPPTSRTARHDRAAAALASPEGPKKRGPNTPEGKARSSMNALKHGLRARAFGILPEEDKAEWAEHVRDLRAGLRPGRRRRGEAGDRDRGRDVERDPRRPDPGRDHGRDPALPPRPQPRQRPAGARPRPLADHRAALHDRRRHGDAARPARLLPAPQGQARRPDRAGAARDRRTARQSELHERKHIANPTARCALPAPAEPDSQNCTNELPAPRSPLPTRLHPTRLDPCAPVSTACWPAPAPPAPRNGIWSSPSEPPGCPVRRPISAPSTRATSTGSWPSAASTAPASPGWPRSGPRTPNPSGCRVAAHR